MEIKAKETNETLSGIALILAILAFVIALGCMGYVYFSENEVDYDYVDAQIEFKTSLVNSQIEGMQDELDDFSFPSISNSDLEDLEDYADDFDEIDDNGRDISEILDCANEPTPLEFLNCVKGI